MKSGVTKEKRSSSVPTRRLRTLKDGDQVKREERPAGPGGPPTELS